MLKTNTFKDYLTLCKPKVILLMLVTSWVGMYLANPTAISWQLWFYGTIGIAFAGSAAATLNHIIDMNIDKIMLRTQMRPIACGRVTSRRALLFATILATTAWLILMHLVNSTTAVLTFATFIGYAVIYTVYLKRATSQNIVIGGLAGAMPPLLGWSTVSANIDARALLLVLIIFTWTPPHFWALAINRYKDYKSANIPMLPVTHGIKFTKFFLLLYTILLFAVCCLPFVIGMSSYIYLVGAIILNAIFISLAMQLYCTNNNKENVRSKRLFYFSILFLLILFVLLIVDKGALVYA